MKPSILETEIAEQPAVIHRLLEQESGTVERIARTIKGNFDYVVIAARGTSDNAARYAKYLLGSHNQLQVALATPSLFTLYDKPPEFSGALVIGISQSGQSPDISAVIREANQQGSPTLAITNSADSPLAQSANHTIRLHAGEEKAVAATKTYTASLVAIALLSCHLAGAGEDLSAVQQLPTLVAQTLENLRVPMKRIERYRYMEHCAVIGRGYNYATAYEIALKIKELTHIVAEPYSSADFRHGPIGMVRDGFPVMVVGTSGSVYEDIRALVQHLRELACELLVISDRQELLEQAQLAMQLPAQVPEWLTPVLAVLPGQLIGLNLARAKGLDPDQPKGLRKVTETW